jgi:hypothetical protein
LGTALQIFAAFLGLIGGLLISLDFIGVDRLDMIEKKTRDFVARFAFERNDYFTSMAGIGAVLWTNIAIVVTAALMLIIVLVYIFIYSLPILYILIAYVFLALIALLLRQFMPGIGFFVLMPIFAVTGLFWLVLEFGIIDPFLRFFYWAKARRFPYFVKLVGAVFAVSGFMVWLASLPLN